MPLSAATLQDEILKLTDAAREDFVGFPETTELVAENWSRTAFSYFALASVPAAAVLVPGAHELARQAMRARMIADFALGGPSALANGLSAYVVALAALVIVGAGVIVPPVGPAPLPPLPPTTDPAEPAAAIAGAVHGWAKTGTFTPTTGSPTSWL